MPIRWQADLVSAPPVPPIDANTDLPIQFWRAQGMSIQVGIFDADDVAVDLSNLQYLQVVLMKASDSLVPLASVTVLAGSIIPTISRADWLNGTAWQANFVFTPAQTDVGLSGAASAPFWMVLQGLTSGNVPITYSAGEITIFNPGSGLPAPVAGLTSFNEQTNGSGNSTITPESQLHTEAITVNGAARTSNLILTAAGLQVGAHVDVYLALPATAGIILRVFDGSLIGALLSTVQTSDDGSLPSAFLQYRWDGHNFRPVCYNLPST